MIFDTFDEVYCSTLFAEQFLRITEFITDKVPTVNNWVIIISCIILILYAVVFTYYHSKSTLLLQSFFTQRHLSLLQRDKKIFDDRILLLFFPTLLLIHALFLTTLIQYYFPVIGIERAYIINFLIILLIIAIFYFIKLLVNNIFFKLFNDEEDVYTVNLNKLVFLNASGVILYPIVLMATYVSAKIFLPVGIIFYTMLFLRMIYKAFFFVNKKINTFQIFIYFCTVEILPYFIGMKMLFILDK